MDLYYGRPNPIDFDLLLHVIPDTEFVNLTRSTVPLLWYWKDAVRALDTIGKAVGCDLYHSQICFEYPVSSLGSNKPSFCDVMCINPQVTVAIEAKSAEGEYEVTSEWLKASPGTRERVLSHWTSMIKAVTGQANVNILSGVPYQLVHRTASVCHLQATRRAVLYQIFEVSSVKVDYRRSLACMAEAVAPDGQIEFYLQVITLKPTSHYKVQAMDLPSIELNKRSFAVRRAIREGNLFQLQSDRIERVLPESRQEALGPDRAGHGSLPGGL